MRLRLNNLPAWVINLNRSHERWVRCFRSLSTVFSEDRIKRLVGIDGLDFALQNSTGMEWNPDILKSLQAEGIAGKNTILDPVRTALCLSHQRALHAFLESGERWGLIFEDDTRIGESIPQIMLNDGILTVPDDAEILFLHDRVKTRSLTSLRNKASEHTTLNWRVVHGGCGLEAYAVNAVGARKILNAWRPLAIECDLQLMTFMEGYADNEEKHRIHHILERTASKRPLSIKAYGLQRALFQTDDRLTSVKLSTINFIKSGKNKTQIAKLKSVNSSSNSQREVHPLSPHLKESSESSLKLSFCITCRGRLEHIKQTLPHNLEIIRNLGDSEIILLNYNSPDQLDEYILDTFKESLRLRILKYAKTRLPDKFLVAHAKNACHKLGTGEFLINLDADQFLTTDYLRLLTSAIENKADVCTFVYDKKVYGGGFGRIAIKREIFHSLGGHDEDHFGYGHEDIDLVERARRSGAKVVQMDSSTAKFIRHGDEIRNLSYKDRGTEAAIWEKFFRSKWDRGILVANQERIWGQLVDIEVRPAATNLTVILTNFKRTANIGQIIDSIPKNAEIFLLDNAPRGFEVPEDVIRRTSWYVKSDGNDPVLRWMLASRAKTEFFCIHDDDLCIKNWNPYLKRAAEVSTLVGPFGVNLNVNDLEVCYSKGYHSSETRECDVIKGRAVFGRSAELRRHLTHKNLAEISIVNDDVFISSIFRKKHHSVYVKNNIIELADNDAVSKRPMHLERRDQFVREFFFDTSNNLISDHPESSVSQGIVLCASPKYSELATRAISSAKSVCPNLPIYCHPAQEGLASRFTKLSIDLWSPFDETLFIDCDTVVCEDLTPVFELLKYGNLFMAKETPKYTTLGCLTRSHWLGERNGRDYAKFLKTLPEDTPIWNSGVILFKKCDQVHAFFKAWRERWKLRGAKTLDQLPLAEIVLELGHPSELPPYWHCQISSQNPKSAIPQAALYHFMGDNKKEAFSRWEIAFRQWMNF